MRTLEAKVGGYRNGVLIVSAPLADEWELIKKDIKTCEVVLRDGREITADQRKKIYATLRDISAWSGHDPEELKGHFKAEYVARTGDRWFSLSDVDMTTASRFLEMLIEFCLQWDIPVEGDSLAERSPDIARYVYLCLVHKKCCVTGKRAELHHVDRVGMGRDRKEIVHLGYRVMPLSRKMHTEAHTIGQKSFEEKYHLFGVKLDESLCKIWNVKGENV